MVRHLAEKLASEYHLFFILPSSSFIHGRNLERFEFLKNAPNHISNLNWTQSATVLGQIPILNDFSSSTAKLCRFLNTIDQLQPTYIGQKTGLGSSCGLKAGILLSKPLLLKVGVEVVEVVEVVVGVEVVEVVEVVAASKLASSSLNLFF